MHNVATRAHIPCNGGAIYSATGTVPKKNPGTMILGEDYMWLYKALLMKHPIELHNYRADHPPPGRPIPLNKPQRKKEKEKELTLGVFIWLLPLRK